MASKSLAWMQDPDFRPYVFVRPENQIKNFGMLHKSPWFEGKEVLFKNPMHLKELSFANAILHMENESFGKGGLAMPRWVFYDCAILPGFVGGYVCRRERLSKELLRVLKPAEDLEWVPISLFIIIPTIGVAGEWIAHNLCSVNSLLPKDQQIYGLGFVSKGFGLWYANVQTCCGITQWGAPSIRLHANYGEFEVLTAYTPVHTIAETLTYRLRVDSARWAGFFAPSSEDTEDSIEPAGFFIDPLEEKSMRSLQARLEKKEGPYFLNGYEVRQRGLKEKLTIYKRRG